MLISRSPFQKGHRLRALGGAAPGDRDIDFGVRQITVRDGKGGKDQVTMLPASVAELLAQHLERGVPSTPRIWSRVSAASSCPPR